LTPAFFASNRHIALVLTDFSGLKISMIHVGEAYGRNPTLVVSIQGSHIRKGCLSSKTATNFASHSVASYWDTDFIEISNRLTVNIVTPESVKGLKRISRKTVNRCIRKYLLVSVPE
jgi:hypothetical protein